MRAELLGAEPLVVGGAAAEVASAAERLLWPTALDEERCSHDFKCSAHEPTVRLASRARSRPQWSMRSTNVLHLVRIERGQAQE